MRLVRTRVFHIPGLNLGPYIYKPLVLSLSYGPSSCYMLHYTVLMDRLERTVCIVGDLPRLSLSLQTCQPWKSPIMPCQHWTFSPGFIVSELTAIKRSWWLSGQELDWKTRNSVLVQSSAGSRGGSANLRSSDMFIATKALILRAGVQKCSPFPRQKKLHNYEKAILCMS